MNSKQTLLYNMLMFWALQIKEGSCDESTIDDISKSISQDIRTLATTKDIAEHFGKCPKDIHNVINRHRYGNKLRPKRKILYNLSELMEIVPSRWIKERKESE